MLLTIFLSTLPAWGATAAVFALFKFSHISIHAPRVGSDTPETAPARIYILFLSTLPAWGATQCFTVCKGPFRHFYPRSPRGERPRGQSMGSNTTLFLSTLPAWGATCTDIDFDIICKISIHAPRVGSDMTATPSAIRRLRHFYPRSPRGERRFYRDSRLYAKAISIHAPRVGSDQKAVAQFKPTIPISIHAPRVGSDFLGQPKQYGDFAFLSTLPAWGATAFSSSCTEFN